MGKKKDKAAARAAVAAAAAAAAAGGGGADGSPAAAAAAATIPWKQIDSDPVGFLVAPETADKFFAECWERAPRVFKATPGRRALAASLTTLPSLLAWVKRQEAADPRGASPLLFGRDVNAARYTDGARETPNGEDEAGSEALRSLHDDDGCTLQVHQPQRWDDGAWRLLAALEARLGELVGANAYLTPPGAQGLAPHHDDVELWVLQTAGRKRWRCYAPLGGFALPNECSGDLPQRALGEPVLEAVLEPGDVLFLPRGTVHQAVAEEGAASAHLTVSTRQRASYGDLALHLLGTALNAQGDEAERALPLSARRGPPPGLAFEHSLHRVLSAAGNGGGPTPGAVAGLAGALRDVAARLEAAPDMLTPAVLAASRDFWAHRLPPHPAQLAAPGPPPELDDAVWCRAARWCCLVPHDGPAGGDDESGSGSGSSSDDDEDEDEEEEHEEEEEEEAAVKLVTCAHNAREAHMMGGGSDDSDSESDDSGSGSGSESGSEDKEEEEEEDSDEPPMAIALDAGDDGRAAAAAKGSSGGGSESEEGGSGEGHDHGHDHEHAHGDCCGIDGCEHEGGGHGHGHGDGLPGIVFPGGETLRALVAVLNADAPGRAVCVRDLPLTHDADKIRLAFALWAEGFAATVRGGKGVGGGGAGRKKSKAQDADDQHHANGQQQPAKKKAKK